MYIDSSRPTKLLNPFLKLVKKNVLFKWDEKQQAFWKVKDVPISPLTMISPIKGFASYPLLDLLPNPSVHC